MMKRLLLLAAFMATIISSCTESVDTVVHPVLEPTGLDEDAATWTPLLVTDTTAYASLTQPTSPTADDVAAVRAAIAGATDADRQDIREWATGSVLKWNDVVCDIVAKYNVAPVAERNGDGSFTGKFIADPQRPFTNPPFAARLYALISVAHYDALVHCWRLKNRTGLPDPATFSAQQGTSAVINASAPKTAASSWPNEDAVLAAATREIISALFPLEKDMIRSLADRAKRARLLAGRAWPADLDAGDSLGAIVARKVLAHAKTDGMANANNQAEWKTIEPTIQTQWPRWKSMETPSRPPMLPLFGKVKTWHVQDPVALDPGAPPTEGSERWNRDLEEMRNLTTNRTREQVCIAVFWEDGGGTYTPPGHWCAITTEELRRVRYSPIRMARVLAFVTTAMHDAAVVCWDVKYRYLSPRPKQVDPSITMSAGLPNFPGYLSGHSMFSASAATVLSHFFPDRASVFQGWALEAADSRVFSRIHFRIDCEVGVTVGNAVGAASVLRSQIP